MVGVLGGEGRKLDGILDSNKTGMTGILYTKG